jgi:hypothetical protein
MSFFSWAMTGTNPIAPDRTNAVKSFFITTSFCSMTLFAASIHRFCFSPVIMLALCIHAMYQPAIHASTPMYTAPHTILTGFPQTKPRDQLEESMM